METTNVFSLADLGRLIDTQLTSAGPLGTVLFLFLGGLLASLLPCVYPLYPITASVVRQRAAQGRSWTHPVAYGLGLASTYAALGFVAGLAGAALNSVLRYGSTNVLIGIVLVLLAFATLGWLHLPFFTERPGGSRPGLWGTVLLGASAGLLSSACVGPVVAGTLINLAASATAGISLGSLAAATGKMFAFGFGVGVPFLLVGLLGLRLPRSGPWMIWIQRALGALLVVFASSYVVKGLTIWGLSEDHALAAFGGALGLLLFSFLLQSAELDVPRRLQRSLYIVGALVSGVVFFRATAPAPAPPVVSANTHGAPEPGAFEQDGNLKWHLDAEAAYAEAQALGKVVFIDFFGSWCTNCKAFQKQTLSDPALNESLRRAVLLKIHDISPAFESYSQDPRFEELKVGLPFFVITDKDGYLLYKTNDYLRTDEMMLFLEE